MDSCDVVNALHMWLSYLSEAGGLILSRTKLKSKAQGEVFRVSLDYVFDDVRRPCIIFDNSHQGSGAHSIQYMKR